MVGHLARDGAGQRIAARRSCCGTLVPPLCGSTHTAKCGLVARFREDDPVAGRERFYRADFAGPGLWLRVVALTASGHRFRPGRPGMSAQQQVGSLPPEAACLPRPLARMTSHTRLRAATRASGGAAIASRRAHRGADSSCELAAGAFPPLMSKSAASSIRRREPAARMRTGRHPPAGRPMKRLRRDELRRELS